MNADLVPFPVRRLAESDAAQRAEDRKERLNWNEMNERITRPSTVLEPGIHYSL